MTRLDRPGAAAPAPDPLTPARFAAMLAAAGVPPDSLRIGQHGRAGRNRLLVAEGPDGGWIAKQDAQGLDGECRFYGGFDFDFAPRCLVCDPRRGVVLRRVVGDTAEAQAVKAPLGALLTLIECAAPIARLHLVGEADVGWSAHLPLLALDPLDVRIWHESTPAARELLSLIQREAILGDAVRAALDDDGPRVLIHGDIKADNIIVAEGGPRLIDWECSGAGPALWDLAALIGSMVRVWVWQLALDERTDPTAWVDEGGVPFAALYLAVGQCIARYRAVAGCDAVDRDRLVTFVVAWLLGRMWAEASQAARLGARLRTMLLFTGSLARRPDRLLSPAPW